MKRLVVFDLDGTLAESKSRIDAEMGALLSDLLRVVRVAVISGGAWPQFEQQLLGGLRDGEHMPNLSLLPTCGTKFYEHDGVWHCAYSEDLTEDEKSRIRLALNDAIDVLHLRPREIWGELIEDRASQITYSALGQHAPIAAKERWDPDFAKRTELKALLDLRLPDLTVRMGGMTSVDITRSGIDKAYGIRKLRDILGIPLDEMLFVGDALFPGGNDYPVEQAGVSSIRVEGPRETKRIIEAVIACLSPTLRPDAVAAA